VQSADGYDDHGHRPQDEERVYGITTAETSHMQDIARRQKQYILTMLVRIVSIVVVVCVPGISWVIKIGLCLVATVIPYIAVVRANGGPAQDRDPTNLLIGGPPRDALGSAQPGLPRSGADDYVQGEYVRSEYGASDVGHTGGRQDSQGSTSSADAAAGSARPDSGADQASDQPVKPR
jgi:hypothetical protein